jgi:hypothetical protein
MQARHEQHGCNGPQQDSSRSLTPANAAQRLQMAQRYFAAAATGEMPLWNTLVAMDALVPLINASDRGWREGNDGLIARVVDEAYGLAPRLASSSGDAIPQDAVFFGLGSMAAALADPEASHMADRVAFSRMLVCRLSLAFDEKGMAERGYPLRSEVHARLGLIAVASPSPAFH